MAHPATHNKLAAGILRAPIKFESGRLAVPAHTAVYVELSNYGETVWIWGINAKDEPTDILYTFNKRADARSYLTLIDESMWN